MSRSTIRMLLEATGFGEHADAVDSLVQPSIRLVATALAPAPMGGDEPDKSAAMDAALEALPLGASRFGGIPDLPPAASWPERDGVPMEFIAQIALADVAALDSDHRLPETGSLLAFENSQWEFSDRDPEGACCAVLYHPGADDELVRATPPRIEWQSDFPAPVIHGLASLAFEATISVPAGLSPYIQSPLDEFWHGFQSELCYVIGESEPYTSNYLLGYVSGPDYVGAHTNGTEDQLLLQVDSCEAAEFQFGDCDKLFFIMTKSELARRDFSNVRLYSLLG